MERDYILQYLLQRFKEADPSIHVFNRYNEDVIKCAVALANHKGGNIIIGIDNNQPIPNAESVDSIILLIKQAFAQRIVPELPYTILPLDNENQEKVLLVSIWEGGKKPYMCDGTIFIYRRKQLMIATVNEAMELFDNRQKMDLSWERQPVISFANDFNQDIVEKLKNVMIEKGTLTYNSTTDDLLYKLALVNNSDITNAGVITLARSPYIYLPQSRIRYAVYGKDNHLIEVRTYEEDLITNVAKISSIISNVYGTKIEFHGAERVEYEVVPLLAIREALYNACVHRDYSSENSFVAVTLYPDKLCISNTGHFGNGIKIEDLDKTHLSILNNPDIANVCFLYGSIEMAGSGTIRIIRECVKNHCKKPIWTEKDDVITITFPDIQHNRVSQGEPSVDLAYLAQNTKRKIELEKIVQYIQSHPYCKTAELVIYTGKSYPMVTRYLQILKEANIIQYEGSLKTGGWQIMIK